MTNNNETLTNNKHIPPNKRKLHSMGKIGSIDTKDLIKVEKSKRRYKTVLPKIEKKLYLLLIQFYKEYNTHFIWNNKPYIDEIEITISSNNVKNE